MTGQYEIEVYNNRVHYSLTIRRNITIIQGDSATGKTALINLISQYEANGASSGITLICEKSCVNLSGSNWQAYLSTLHDCIVFVDEGAPFIRSRKFASAIKGSDNYYVLIYRDALPELPYSIEEIYGLQTVRPSQKYITAKRVYNEMVHLYNSAPNQAIRPNTVVTEDSNSGFEFFSCIFKDRCVSSQGKDKILEYLRTHDTASETLVIADGAAFGANIEAIMSFIKSHERKCVLYAPESFEYLILSSGVLEVSDDVLRQTYRYADSRKYFSWEEFYTAYLIERSVGTVYQYNKHALPEAYLTAGSIKKISATLPEQIRPERL